MDINFELYKVFYHVATTLSFSAAADRLFLSQSAVSQSIKTLEKKINHPLFIRNTKRVQLTPEGEILLRYIEPAITLFKRGEDNLSEINEKGGQIKIAATDTICRYFLVPYLKAFHNKFPNAHIKIVNGTSIRCAELLETGQVDLILVNQPNKYLGGNAVVKDVFQFKDVFIANEHQYPDLKGKKVTLKQLIEHPILMLDKNSTTHEFLHYIFQREQLNFVPEIELESNDLLIDLASIGLGVAFVPGYCLTEKNSEDLFVVDTEEVFPERNIAIAYNGLVPVSKTVLEFLNFFEH